MLPARRAGRAHQLDALRLDDEVHTVLYAHLSRALRHYPADVWRSIQPEVSFALRFLIWACTTLSNKPTPGLSYQNLRYSRDTDTHGGAHTALTLPQKLALLLAGGGAAWIRARVSRLASTRGWRRVERALRVASALQLVFRAGNALLFMRYARHRSLEDRFAGAQVSYIDLDVSRAPPLEILPRAFVWRSVAGLALFIAPLVPSLMPGALHRLLTRTPPAPPAGATACAVCGATRPVMPHSALPCRCVFCYACVATEREKRPRYSCPRCSVSISKVQRCALQREVELGS